MRTTLLLTCAIAGFAADDTPAPTFTKPTAGEEVADTLAILVQRQPTSGDAEPGLFRMQGEAYATLVSDHDDNGADLFATSVGFWLPISDKHMSLRFGTDVFRDDFDGHSDLGIGDLGVRWDWTPQITGPNGLLVEVDTTWDTASKDRLGAGVHTIAPGVAYVIPLPKALTLSPAIDHRFSWGSGDGADVSHTQIHGYVTWAGDGRFWAQADPAINIDQEHDDSWLAVDVLGGMRLREDLFVWAEPGFALSDDRPYDVRVSGGIDMVF